MALILNIETSSPVCSVCLAKDETLIDFREDKTGNSHAKILTVFIDELFKSNKLSFSELDAVAISSGPGSYTGLRIGTSVAKGLCYALNKPLIAVPTLLALAHQMRASSDFSGTFYLPALDARRMDIYAALYDYELNEVIKTDMFTVDTGFENSLEAFKKIVIGGSGAAKVKQLITSEKFEFIETIECDSRSMIYMSYNRYAKNQFENLAYFEPNYVNQFPAKTKN